MWVGGIMHLAEHATTMSLDGASGGVMLPGLSANERRTVLYMTLFPNLLVSAHPDYVMTHRVEPVSANETWIECSWMFDPAAIARPDFDPAYAVDFWDIVNRQDWQACESVQRGVQSRGYRPGPFSLREDLVQQFVQLCARSYLAGALIS
jgi:Rieske 2Fe-2S family protein